MQTVETPTPAQAPAKPQRERTDGEPRLAPDTRRRLAILALPTTALALAITVVSTYLSEITRRYTHDTVVIGLIVGGEGVMALWVPLLAGAWSDQLQTRIGGRLPFLLAGGVPAAVALVLIGFLHSLGAVAAAAAVFFGFYFVAYEPYRALYPDMVSAEKAAGRAQSTQAIARGVGTGLALLGGGLLLSIGRVLPFAVAAVVLVGALGAFTALITRRGVPPQEGEPEPARVLARRLVSLLVEHRVLRAYLLANALWETALAALKAFVILYITLGLGYGLSSASLIVGGVAVVILGGAALAGKVADRVGGLRVLAYALPVYGCGFLLPAFTTSRWLIGLGIPFLAIGGGTVMTLAYAVLMPLMPEGEHGALTGFYSVSRGVGIIAGPLLAGLLVHFTQSGIFSATSGFQAVWVVCAAAAFASLPLVWLMRRDEGDRRQLRED